MPYMVGFIHRNVDVTKSSLMNSFDLDLILGVSRPYFCVKRSPRTSTRQSMINFRKYRES